MAVLKQEVTVLPLWFCLIIVTTDSYLSSDSHLHMLYTARGKRTEYHFLKICIQHKYFTLICSNSSSKLQYTHTHTYCIVLFHSCVIWNKQRYRFLGCSGTRVMSKSGLVSTDPTEAKGHKKLVALHQILNVRNSLDFFFFNFSFIGV